LAVVPQGPLIMLLYKLSRIGVCDRVMVELSKDIVGQYEILEKIREGGMGAIYKVRHRVLDQIRIIKTMRSKLKSDALLRQRFETEARTASRLRHDNIAQLFDFALDDEGNAFMVLEYIDGFDLDEILEAFGPPPVTLCVEIASQCLDALGYLHQRGIIHRDISPDNLMVSRDEDELPLVKLIDLGVAKVLRDQNHQTREGTFLGKLRYASPEQLGSQADRPVDHRTDLYSFGVVLYELLTGQHPVRGDSAQALVAGHLTRPPIPFSETDPRGNINPALREVVFRALAKDPENRFANAREFRDAMVQAQPGYPFDLEVFASWFQKREEKKARGTTAEFSSTQHRLDRQFEAARQEKARASRGTRRNTSQVSHSSETGKIGEEERGTEEAASLEPALRAQFQNLIKSARAATGSRRFDQARMFLRSARELAPNDPELLAAEEMIREKRQKRREAMARARKIARGIQRIEAMITSGELDEAENALHELRGSVGNSDDLDRIAGLIHEKRGNGRLSDVPPAVDEVKLQDSDSTKPAHEPTAVVSPQKRVFKSLRAEHEEPADQETDRDTTSLTKKTAPVPELSQDVLMLNQLLAAGDLVNVDRHLHRLLLEKGFDARLDAFRERFDKIREERIEELLREIDEALEGGDRARARERLEEGEQLDNEHPGITAVRRKLLGLEERQQKLDALRLLLDRQELEEAGRLIENETGREEDPDWQTLKKRYLQLKAFEEISSLKNSGDFEDALQLLLGLEERDSEIFGGLETEIREAVRRRAALQQLLEGAEHHAGRQEYDTAIELLEEAMNLEPENEKIQKKHGEFREAHRRILVEKQATEIEATLQAGEFGRATEALGHAVQSLGRHEVFSSLEQRIQRQRCEAVEDLDTRITQALSGGKIEEADSLIEEAAGIQVEESRLLQWRNQLEHCRQSRDLRIQLEHFLDAGMLNEAEELLETQPELSAGEDFSPLKERLRQEKKLLTVEQLIEAGEYDRAGLLLEELQECSVKERLARILREKIEEAEKKKSEDILCSRIQEKLESGDFQEAMGLLDASDPASDSMELKELRKKLQTLQRHRRRIDTAIEKIQSLVERGALREGRERLLQLKNSESISSTLELTGGGEAFEEISTRIFDAFEQLEKHLAAAKKSMKGKRFEDAYDELNRALNIAPGEPVVEELLEETGKELRRIAKERRRQQREAGNHPTTSDGESGMPETDDTKPEDGGEAPMTPEMQKKEESLNVDIPGAADQAPAGGEERTFILGPDELPGPSEPIPDAQTQPPLPGTSQEDQEEMEAQQAAALPMDRELIERTALLAPDELVFPIPLPGLLYNLVWPVQALPEIELPWDLCPTPNDNPLLRVSIILSVAQSLDLVSAALLFRALDGNIMDLPTCRASIRCGCTFDDEGHVFLGLQIQPLPDDEQILSREKRNLLRTQVKKAVIRILGRLKRIAVRGGKIERSWSLNNIALRPAANLRPQILCFGFDPETADGHEAPVPFNIREGQPLAMEIEVENQHSGFLLFPFQDEAALWVADLPKAALIPGARL